MSDLDLRAAIEAGETAYRAAYFNGVLGVNARAEIVAAAAPLIEQAVREKVAAEIEAWESASADDVLTRGAWSDGVRFGLHVALDIARETP